MCSVLAREGALVAVSDVNKSTAEETVSMLDKYKGTSDVMAGEWNLKK